MLNQRIQIHPSKRVLGAEALNAPLIPAQGTLHETSSEFKKYVIELVQAVRNELPDLKPVNSVDRGPEMYAATLGYLFEDLYPTGNPQTNEMPIDEMTMDDKDYALPSYFIDLIGTSTFKPFTPPKGEQLCPKLRGAFLYMGSHLERQIEQQYLKAYPVSAGQRLLRQEPKTIKKTLPKIKMDLALVADKPNMPVWPGKQVKLFPIELKFAAKAAVAWVNSQLKPNLPIVEDEDWRTSATKSLVDQNILDAETLTVNRAHPYYLQAGIYTAAQKGPKEIWGHLVVASAEYWYSVQLNFKVEDADAHLDLYERAYDKFTKVMRPGEKILNPVATKILKDHAEFVLASSYKNAISAQLLVKKKKENSQIDPEQLDSETQIQGKLTTGLLETTQTEDHD